MAVKNGFSIIELIVVVGLIALLGVAMSAIMLTTITSSNRVRTSTKIKQAGDYTIGQIQTLIRNARRAITCTSPSQVTLENQDGGQTTISLSAGKIASNSAFITPDDLSTTNYSLTCGPNDTDPTTIKISFDLQNLVASTKSTEHPVLHFETTAQLRND